MYTAERQRALPYLDQVTGPLFEQWYFLHHRLVRIVTNHVLLMKQVQHFLYYAELLAENTYDSPTQLPVEIPEDLLWQVGERLYRPVALTCYLFETQLGDAAPPAPAEAKPDDIEWDNIGGVNGPLRAHWKNGPLRLREFQLYAGVTSRINTMIETNDLYATIFIEDVQQCASWFLMRYVFYMVLGAMFGYDGYQIIHAGAVAVDGEGILLVGSPASGKTTLLLSCLQQGIQLLADDVLFLAKDDGVVHTYSFPENIGVRTGTAEMLSQYPFMQNLIADERRKRFIDVQCYFRGQVISACPVRLVAFIHADDRDAEFRTELLPPTLAVSWLIQEYLSHQRAKEAGADHMFDIFTSIAAQAPSYRLWLSPDLQENARQMRDLLEKLCGRP